MSAETEAEILMPQADDVDPFFKILANRVGPSIAGSFTASQFMALKRAFGTRPIGRHPIDIRDSYTIFGFSFYMVLLMGRETRSADRRALEGVTGMTRVLRGAFKALLCGGVFAAGAIILIVCSATN
ncbi:hypothetical protein GCM10011611_00940 [Aliidongia dinghuensis]|uniref:Uncharacterized protein n=1 Tax=Aliidongia dinghuensis TaxID=1867774 RepID=A0A8J2YPG2_9PROT|nr:hypothetical protein [Aliidongia dinghuensis]GGE99201.1 hypothetical protein GCM10011611_00940 [Aliidongia dinghuensis]